MHPRRGISMILAALALGGGLAACGDDDAEDAARDAGQAIEQGAEDAGQAVEEGAEEAGEAAQDGAEAAGDAAEDLGDEVEQQTE